MHHRFRRNRRYSIADGARAESRPHRHGDPQCFSTGDSTALQYCLPDHGWGTMPGADVPLAHAEEATMERPSRALLVYRALGRVLSNPESYGLGQRAPAPLVSALTAMRQSLREELVEESKLSDDDWLSSA